MGEALAVSEYWEAADADAGSGSSLFPMCFGVSCAFVAIRLISRTKGPDMDSIQWFRIGETMLRGSTQLLGLLVWRAQRDIEKARTTEAEINELKRQRTEDARANEKVVSIFAAQEQSWLAEKKRLKLQIQAMFAQFRIIEAKKEEMIAGLNQTVEEKDRFIGEKDAAMEEEAQKQRELEEKVRTAEAVAEELRERVQKEAEKHAAELLKHKTAYVELGSKHRQLEAELSRVLRQAEAVRGEMEVAVEEKREAAVEAQRVTEETRRLQRDAEQKDKILSAMLRKSKLDTAEKQMLLNEVRVSKARKKQAEIEAERWRVMWESAMAASRRRKGSRGLNGVEAGTSQSQHGRNGIHPRATMLLEYLDAESREEREFDEEDDDRGTTTEERRFSAMQNDELIMTDIRRLQEWVRSETEKYATVLDRRHYTEIEAFTEQMRLKEEKLEALRWQLLTAELEMKRLQSHIDGLDGNLSQVREESLRLEAKLLGKEKELKSVKDRFALHMLHCRKSSNHQANSGDFLGAQDVWSEAKVSRRSKEEEEETSLVSRTQVDGESAHDPKRMSFDWQLDKDERYEEKTATDAMTTSSSAPRPSFEGKEESPLQEPEDDISASNPVREDEIEEEKGVILDQIPVRSTGGTGENAGVASDLSVAEQQPHTRRGSTWKMDLQAMGVSYKIKRLKQQLLVLEKLIGRDPPGHKSDGGSDRRKADDKKQAHKGFLQLMPLLNKQVKRYHSLEEKTDDLCKRMHESEQNNRGRESSDGRGKEKTETLEHFLEETFQLQRYMVATGQKLMEIQSRVTCSFINGTERFDERAGFNMGQFADIVRSLFKDIQRGLEVRIARIIGNLEGTLAREGILHMRT